MRRYFHYNPTDPLSAWGLLLLELDLRKRRRRLEQDGLSPAAAAALVEADERQWRAREWGYAPPRPKGHLGLAEKGSRAAAKAPPGSHAGIEGNRARQAGHKAKIGKRSGVLQSWLAFSFK